MCDVVEFGNVLLCPFYCIHHYVDVLLVHLNSILGDVKIEMTWTKVSSLLCCVGINWLTFFLILLTSLVIAVPLSEVE